MPADPAGAILDFWFGPPPWEPRKIWFEKDAGFDAAIAARFSGDYARAKAGEYDALAGDWRGALALILLLDQVPRNLYRGDARAFATDAAALKWAKFALAQGYDRQAGLVERRFFYLPFEHAENLAEQERSLELFSIYESETYKYAERHYEIIARFGRFPHRNAALGRASTAEEIAFLEEPNSSF